MGLGLASVLNTPAAVSSDAIVPVVSSQAVAATPPAASPAATPAQPALNQLADKGSPKLTVESKASPAPRAAELSQAEQITRLERTIERDQMRLSQLHADLNSPESEFNLAEAAFKAIDLSLADAKAVAATLEEDEDAAGLAETQAKIADLTKTWKLARERFDLAIETRKTQQQQIAALEAKLEQDRSALDKLKGNVPPVVSKEPTEPAAAAPAEPVSPTEPPSISALPALAAAPIGLPVLPAPAPAAPTPKPEPAPAASPAASLLPGLEAAPAAAAPTKPVSKELEKARSDADQKREEAAAAEREVQSVAARIAALERDIELEQKLLVAAQKKSDLAFQSGASIDQEYDKRAAEGTSPIELLAMRKQRREAEQLFARAREEVRDRTTRLTHLQQQLSLLQREELAALSEAQARQHEAAQAEEILSELSNPYALRNLLQWLLDHGPKIGIILISMLVLRLFAILSSQRFVMLIIERGARGTKQEREDRARTLMGVFRNAFSTTIVVGGLLMLCEEAGIAVGPLMGGAAVLGLAAAFGAQNLIRDYFYGFVILIENQYKINDVLRIGNISGQVEQITLRMTVLRDLEGAVHFIPNGKIDSVTNMTHGWSRAMIDVRVSYRENVDQVMDELVQLGLALRKDITFGPLIIDNPEMLGVDGLGESAVTIRMLMKTRPLQQWKVKRELLRRIKQRFDELGWEIPFPQQKVQHRFDGQYPVSESLALEATPRLPLSTTKAA